MVDPLHGVGHAKDKGHHHQSGKNFHGGEHWAQWQYCTHGKHHYHFACGTK